MRQLLFPALLLLLAAIAPPFAPARAQQGGDDGAGFLERWLETRLSAAGREVRIEGFRGALSGRAELEALTIADARGVWLTVRGAVLDWNRAALLSGRLEVAELAAEEIILARLPEPEPAPGAPLPDLPAARAPGFSLPELPVEIDIRRLAVARLRLEPPVLGEAVELTGTGNARLAGGAGTAALDIRRTDGREGAVSLRASHDNAAQSLALEMSVTEPEGGIAARLLGVPGQPALSLRIAGEGTPEDFAADLSLDVAAARALSGRFALAAQPTGGDLRFTLEIAGDLRQLLPPQLAPAAGSHATLSLRGARSAGGLLRLTDIALDSGTLRITGAAILTPEGDSAPTPMGPRADLDLTVVIDDLAPLSGVVAPPLPGPLGGGVTLRLRGKLAPLGGAFDLALEGRTRDITLGLARLDPLLSGEGRLAVAARRDASGTRLERAEFATARATLRAVADFPGAEGTARLEAEIADVSPLAPGLAGAARLALTLDGAGGLWQIRLSGEGPGGARLAAEGTGTVRSGALAALEGTARADVQALAGYSGLAGRSLSGTARLQAQGRADFTAKAWSLTIDGEAQDLALAEPLLDPLLRGTARLSARLRGPRQGLAMLEALKLESRELSATVAAEPEAAPAAFAVSARLRDMGLVAPGLAGELTVAGTARAGATSDDGSWRIDIAANGPAGLAARAVGSIRPALPGAELSMTGTAPLALANRLVAPRLLSGRADFDLRLDGPLALEGLSGRLRLSEAGAALPALQISLTGVSGEARIADGAAELAASGRARSGGRFGLAGRIGLAPPNDAALTLQLDGLVIRRPPLLEATANAALTLTGPLATRALLGGRVDVITAELRLSEGLPTGAAPLPGLRHRNLPARVRETLLRAGLLEIAPPAPAAGRTLGLDLLVSAPARVFLRGRGVDAEFGGSLRLGGTVDEVIPTGGLQLLRGRMEFLGRRLELEEATVTLRGSFDPLLRLRAATATPDGLRAAVLVEGSASDPVVTISSSPPLPEDEILARLAFGRDISNLSPLQAVQLASAISTLSGAGGAGVVDRIRALFGLDDLEVTSSETGGPRVRLGRYLGENLYTDVEIDAAGRTAIDLELSVSPSVTVRGRLDSTGDTGLGLFYERDY
ncbi:translocation and assembly module TamB [Meinhardsimonia xiamenensis]|jgi:translocation and assembly module TamB|uniref:Translocation and assembly module TamB n=1 Tax=Meinhardsimonia xiamenensis TaxID=990712 RepID=A0A1G8YAP1_9RHOB|nr:translocation/assembly module TamB domain-containing protein [Meinhardsimonia xiamenensis]PRX37227.1 translocation and assembly module TamB [Meinhardsimonia xiamenensis]SDJ99743.1 translocation and assembly module TamB [Meinhardsimonia xiamenensis]